MSHGWYGGVGWGGKAPMGVIPLRNPHLDDPLSHPRDERQLHHHDHVEGQDVKHLDGAVATDAHAQGAIITGCQACGGGGEGGKGEDDGTSNTLTVPSQLILSHRVPSSLAARPGGGERGGEGKV